MNQTGLIQHVIGYLGLGNGMKGDFTLSEKRPLAKDANGKHPCGMFSYSRIFGMRIYLSSHTRPDIFFAINFCTRYMFSPKIYHELALKRLARYLKHNQDCIILLDPNPETFKVDAYPDADFTGMHGHEKHDYLACAMSRTGLIITFDDCPVL